MQPELSRAQLFFLLRYTLEAEIILISCECEPASSDDEGLHQLKNTWNNIQRQSVSLTRLQKIFYDSRLQYAKTAVILTPLLLCGGRKYPYVFSVQDSVEKSSNGVFYWSKQVKPQLG